MDESIYERIFTIIHEIVPIEMLSIEEKFAVIGSDSIKAVVFLSAIEEEFEIELDDEVINSRFFLEIDYVVNCINEIML